MTTPIDTVLELVGAALDDTVDVDDVLGRLAVEAADRDDADSIVWLLAVVTAGAIEQAETHGTPRIQIMTGLRSAMETAGGRRP